MIGWYKARLLKRNLRILLIYQPPFPAPARPSPPPRHNHPLCIRESNKWRRRLTSAEAIYVRENAKYPRGSRSFPFHTELIFRGGEWGGDSMKKDRIRRIRERADRITLRRARHRFSERFDPWARYDGSSIFCSLLLTKSEQIIERNENRNCTKFDNKNSTKKASLQDDPYAEKGLTAYFKMSCLTRV